jgi:hypothetical protein
LCLAIALCCLGLPGAARADLGSLGGTTIGLAIAGGVQPDSRSCAYASMVRSQDSSMSQSDVGSGPCLLFAGGIEGSILWRGHLGVAIGLYSVSGQAVLPRKQSADGDTPPAFPDRVSVPLILDTRPFSVLRAAGGTGYLARFLHGIRFGLGPSFELVRTSSDSSVAWGQRIGEPVKAVIGAHFTFDGEIPLHAAAASALSLRLSTRLLYVPLVPLNDGAVRSSPFDADPPVGATFIGYGLLMQAYLGLVYYL